jgi:hypothetical protein
MATLTTRPILTRQPTDGNLVLEDTVSVPYPRAGVLSKVEPVILMRSEVREGLDLA